MDDDYNDGYNEGWISRDEDWQDKIRDKIYRLETLGLDQDQTTIDVLKELLGS